MSKKYRCTYVRDDDDDNFVVDSVYELNDENRVVGADGYVWGPHAPTTIKWLENQGWYKFEEVKDMEFTLDDIKTGDKITMRNGCEAVAMFGGTYDYFIGSDSSTFGKHEDKDDFRQDMTHKTGEAYDIVRVDRCFSRLHLSGTHSGFEHHIYVNVFKRDERKKMTVDEIEAALGYKVAIVDEDGKEEK